MYSSTLYKYERNVTNNNPKNIFFFLNFETPVKKSICSAHERNVLKHFWDFQWSQIAYKLKHIQHPKIICVGLIYVGHAKLCWAIWLTVFNICSLETSLLIKLT